MEMLYSCKKEIEVHKGRLGTALILAIEGHEEEFKKCIKEAEKYIEEIPPCHIQ